MLFSTAASKTYGRHMGRIWAAHMQPICGPYVECFQKQPNCMWPICCLTYGNIGRKTNQHMSQASTYGKHIWADVVILALKVSTSEHMGSIMETYGKHTLYGQYPEQHKQTSPFPCCCSTLNLLKPWDVLLRHGDWRCATEDVLLRPGLAWLQWSRTSFRCARLNTDVDPRTRDESLRLAKKKSCR